MELTANGVRLHYEVSGRGPAVVLLHGNGANLHFFDALTTLLEPLYTVYRLDSRRHGESEKTKEISYDLLAQDTAAFIQALGLSRPALIGSSDGGITGLLLAIGWPGLLSCAVVCGANTHPRKLKRWFYWAFRLGGMKPGQQTLRMVAQQPDITPQQLASIRTPVLVMAGEKDITLPGHQREIAAAIPGAQLCILPGEGHVSYLKKPQVFLAHAGEFLRAHAGGHWERRGQKAPAMGKEGKNHDTPAI